MHRQWDLLGLWVEEWEPLAEGRPVRLEAAGKADVAAAGSLFSERVHPEGGGVLYRYGDGLFAGSPAICRHKAGHGECVYLSTLPEVSFLAKLLGGLAREAGVEIPLRSKPPGGEIVERRNGGERVLFLLNHNRHQVRIELEELEVRKDCPGQIPAGRWLFSGQKEPPPPSECSPGRRGRS